MSYQVLARKWRPRNFSELVGQEHVRQALTNALDNDRLHHAFLFTGTRGVGKTTIARILAKSLNCEQGISSTPCGVCSTCTEINEGRYVDLIEVDAASRTKVDETRELLENVQYAPTRGRYKVYLIDEVHMFSNHSFNALLKTLEEPPPHVKFLLATTDPQKLPVTILSRCLQFNLKRLTIELIRDHLAMVLGKETIEFDTPALSLIARAADGSMRDALSLLDQAIAFGGGTLRESDVRSMLGSIEQHHVIDLLNGLADGDAAALLARISQLAEQSPDFIGVLAEVISTLHRIALAQAVPDAVSDEMADRDDVLSLAKRLTPEDVQLYYQIALIGRRDLPLAPTPRGGFDMVLLRMLAFRPDANPGNPAPRPSRAQSAPAVESPTSPASAPVTTQSATQSSEQAAAQSSEQAAVQTPAQATAQPVPQPASRPATQAATQAAAPAPSAGASRHVSAMADLRSQLGGKTGLKPAADKPRATASAALQAKAPAPIVKAVPPAPTATNPVPPQQTASPVISDDMPPMPDYLREAIPLADDSTMGHFGPADAPMNGALAVAESSPDFPPSTEVVSSQLPAHHDTPTKHDTPQTPVARPSKRAPAPLVVIESVPAPDEWEQLVSSLSLVGVNQQLALNCALKSREGSHFQLCIDSSRAQLLSKSREDILRDALSQQLGETVTLSVREEQTENVSPAKRQKQRQVARQRQAEASIEQDHAVQALQETFAAQINPGSVQPID